MRVFEYSATASPRQRGQAHGEAFRGMIGELATIRTDLAMKVAGFTYDQDLLALAKRHLPVLERFDKALFDELVGIAEGACVDPASVVVLNHYTDLRDIRSGSSAAGPDDGCSVVYSRGAQGHWLGQTWDMHGSAEPYVFVLGVPESEQDPGGWFFSLCGCLGMTGLSRRGVAVSINNLRSRDARVGVVWPALVRRAARENTCLDAVKIIEDAEMGSGHHYLLASPEGAVGLETSGTECRRVFEDDLTREETVFVHTNHCLDPRVEAKSAVVPGSTTFDRYRVLSDLEAGPGLDGASLWRHLGSHVEYPRAVCTHLASPSDPHASKTCGGLVMDLAARELTVAEGCLHFARPLTLSF